MKDHRHIVFFDGVCNLCNSSVQFLIRHDRKGRLHYASLQSAAAADLLGPFNIDTEDPETGDPASIVFLDDGEIFTHSDAALRISRYLDGPWTYLYAFRFVPRSVRDAVYRFIARNRYRWFGKKDECMIPDADIRGRFIGESAG